MSRIKDLDEGERTLKQLGIRRLLDHQRETGEWDRCFLCRCRIDADDGAYRQGFLFHGRCLPGAAAAIERHRAVEIEGERP